MKMRAETYPRARNRSRAVKQLAAGVRWTVSSWLKPADREARWEQNQRQCGGTGEKR